MTLKILKTILFLSIYSSLFGQVSDATILYGKVTIDVPDLASFSYAEIAGKKYDSDSSWNLLFIPVDENGYFNKALPKNTKVVLSTYYNGFYRVDTTVNTGFSDSLNLSLIISPKEYIYTERKAGIDISNRIIQLITFDSLIYDWNQKINYTDKFGFNYTLLNNPLDYDFTKRIYEYNSLVYNHLDSLNLPNWREKIITIEDSLTHLEADNYGKENDIDLKELTFPKNARLPKTMIKLIEEQALEFERLFNKNQNKYTEYTSEFVLDKINNDSNYHYVFVAQYWLAFNFEDMIPELIRRLTDKKEIGLINTVDLIIHERIQSGDLNDYGHGSIANDDLFSVAGRVNHLLKKVTGEDFGSVSMYSTDEELKKFQNRWAYWLMNLKVK